MAALRGQGPQNPFHTREGLVYAVNGISYEMEEGETLGM
jgi:ABC-type oligopeptide transport system ATPase subunit